MKAFLTREAKKQRQKLRPADQKKIQKKLSLLTSEPSSGKKLASEFAGLCSLKAWPFRIIYLIQESRKEVWIISILHRQGAYK